MNLGNGAMKGWWGAPHKQETQQEGFHGDPLSWSQPCQRPSTSAVTLKDLEWKYFPNTVPGSDLQGWEGQGSKI